MGDKPDRNFRQTPLGRDKQGEQNIVGTGNVFEQFLLGGERGNNQFDEVLQQFDLPLGIFSDALKGILSGAGEQFFTTALEDTLSAQSQARENIESTLAGTRPQFGADRIRARAEQGFARDRGRLRTDILNNFITTLLPVLGQAVSAQSQRAGVAQGALAGGQNFNRVSQGRAAQQQNQAIAGQPPQGKDNSGAGALVGMAAPALLGSGLGALGVGGLTAGTGALAGLGIPFPGMFGGGGGTPGNNSRFTLLPTPGR